MLLQKDVTQELALVKKKLSYHNEKILFIFEYMKKAEKKRQQQLEQNDRKNIGYKLPEKKLKF